MLIERESELTGLQLQTSSSKPPEVSSDIALRKSSSMDRLSINLLAIQKENEVIAAMHHQTFTKAWLTSEKEWL